ncbi:MAG: hypothetical protein QGF92_07515, partial [Gammaproteobacteria bacterium]|nr:hypothetical protein [Gammaproteobacteria bacterium]
MNNLSWRHRILSAVIVIFVAAVLLLTVITAQAGDERVSTAGSFVTGDIFVAATVMDVPDDDHAGTGRLLQFDADLKFKGELWIAETT